MPSIDRFELVSEGAATHFNAPIYNDWGLHQPRIVRHNDGTIRLIYIAPDNGHSKWVLMRRDPTGKWMQENQCAITDDACLLRDPSRDKALVVAYADSIPTIYEAPSFAPSPIPGNWQQLTDQSKHYGNVGMSLGGTLMVKSSREYPVQPETASCATEWIKGSFNKNSNKWEFGPFVSRNTGLRHAYDYLFPVDDLTKFIAVSTSDLYKAAAGMPNLDAACGNYVFNGIRFYGVTPEGWLMAEHGLNASGNTTPPLMRVQDALLSESMKELLIVCYVNDPNDSEKHGFFIYDSEFNSHKLNLPAYGYCRLYEDSSKKLWLVWSNQGTTCTQVVLYQVNSDFTLTKAADLSSSFYPYAITGNLYFTVERGGNDKQMCIDAIFNAASEKYKQGVTWDSSHSYGANNDGCQKVFYVRIGLA